MTTDMEDKCWADVKGEHIVCTQTYCHDDVPHIQHCGRCGENLDEAQLAVIAAQPVERK
jgi:hypothetical protein